MEQLQRQQIELAPTVTPIVVTEAEKAEDSQEAVGTVPAEEPGEDPVNKRDEGQLEGAREEGREEQEVSSRVKEVEAAAEAAERGKNEANEELRKRRASMVQNAEQVINKHIRGVCKSMSTLAITISGSEYSLTLSPMHSKATCTQCETRLISRLKASMYSSISW